MANDENIPLKGVYAEKVLEFVRSANEYCTWLEELDINLGELFIKEAVKNLSKIYYRAVELDEIAPVLEGGNERFVTEQQWSAIFQKVMNILGPHNSYLRIADGEEFDRSDLVTHKISEDLADIYQDMKDFVSQYRQGIEEVMNDALWEVMDNFDHYWSEKLLNALRALNSLYVKKIIPGEKTEDDLENGDETPPSYDNSFFTRLQDFNEEDI